MTIVTVIIIIIIIIVIIMIQKRIVRGLVTSDIPISKGIFSVKNNHLQLIVNSIIKFGKAEKVDIGITPKTREKVLIVYYL